jgi:uracil-DNA glycosylase family 4
MSFWDDMKNCTACGLSAKCTQVVLPYGDLENPVLLIVGEAPANEEDEVGRPFVGPAGEVLREVLRATGVLDRRNTCLTNTIQCRPARNKFPTKKEIPSVCTNKWVFPMIERLKPQRMLLLGAKTLKYVGGLDGITKNRGTWFKIKGVRTMATFHPSFIMRKDQDGNLQHRRLFTGDIMEVAEEVENIRAKEKG